MEVYILQHIYEAANGEEDVKLLGVYSSELNAQDAISRLRDQSGFRDHPEGFHISRYNLDEDHWREGFISWKEATE